MLRWAYFAAGTIIGATLLLGQGEQIPSWWFSSTSKLVAADPAFVHLSFDARKKILAQIDPKFAKLSSDKQDLFLWKAETDNLPKAPPPKQFYTWSPTPPTFTAEVKDFGDFVPVLTKTSLVSPFTVEATVSRAFGFFRAHVRIVNGSQSPQNIRPQIFTLEVVWPKHITLFFEYPNRVSYRLIMGAIHYSDGYVPPSTTVIRSAPSGRAVATIETPDPVAKQESRNLEAQVVNAGMTLSQQIEPKALKELLLSPGATAEGDVFFERDDYAREVVLKVFVGDILFQFPFNTPKTD